jgi:hypothetical protein
MISTSLQREQPTNTGVGFVNLFERYDKARMNGRARNMNLWFDWALLECVMSHIDVTDTSSIAREDYTMRGMHLNCQGKKRLTQLIAKRVVGGHASGINSIPVITDTRASRSYSLSSQAQRCLTYIKCNLAVLEVHKQNAKSSNSINIFHQNVRRFTSKSDELIHSSEININPHTLYLSEHHMAEHELLHLTMNGYLLGSRFCRKDLQRRGVCIFVRADQYFSKIYISHYFKEQDFESVQFN